MESLSQTAWRPLAAGLLAALGLGLAVAIAAESGRLGVGATFDTLQVGSIAYQRVQVRSVNARTLMIAHAGGLASVRLRDLSPELQAAFGYDSAADAAANAALSAPRVVSEPKPAADIPSKPPRRMLSVAGASFDALLQSFGQPPEIRPLVDLRPKFSDLALNVKNQGPRPSCAVFAIVSALEYQNAQLTGRPERFSEEYLVWATGKTLNRLPRSRPAADTAAGTPETDDSEGLDTADEGFALSEVVTALRAFGVPLQSSLPYSFGRTTPDPPNAVIAEARSHRRVSVFALPGRDQPMRIANLVHALNAGVPVAVGLRWPQWRTLRSGYLSAQKPLEGTGHAVTMVGYENKTGALKDTVFIFKNSWGVRWGASGYGYATYAYLDKNLVDTALLEVEPGEPAKPAR